jgi:phage-related protein
MTTPNSGSTGGGVMQNELTMTQAAYQAFETAVGDLQQIYNQVSDANMTLNGAMISTSSSVWQQGTGQWIEDFNALKGNLQNIADQLNQQIRQMVANEANNVGLANGVASVSGGSALL